MMKSCLQRYVVPCRGAEFVTYTDGQAALGWLAQNHARTDLIIADLVMPALDGITFLKQAARLAPNIHRMLLSGNVSSLSLREAINQAMVSRVLAKPVSVAMLKEAIDRILKTDLGVKKHADRSVGPYGQQCD